MARLGRAFPRPVFVSHPRTSPVTSAPAGAPAATGVANDATVKVKSNAGAPAPSCVVTGATTRVKPNAGAPAPGGIVTGATVAIAKRVSGGAVSATGAVTGATTKVKPNAGTPSPSGVVTGATTGKRTIGAASGSCAVTNATVAIQLTTGSASVSGVVTGATSQVKSNAEAPAGTGLASDSLTGGSPISAAAGAARASADAYDADGGLTHHENYPPEALGTGATDDLVPSLTFSTELADATVSTDDAVVDITYVTGPADVADVVGEAGDAYFQSFIYVFPDEVAGNVAALDAGVVTSFSTGGATATGDVTNATISHDAVPRAMTAIMDVNAHNASIDAFISMGDAANIASAVGSVGRTTVGTNKPDAPVVTATGAAYDPEIKTGPDQLWIATRSGLTQSVTSAPVAFIDLDTVTGTGSTTSVAERRWQETALDPAPFASGNEPWVSWTISVGSTQFIQTHAVAPTATGIGSAYNASVITTASAGVATVAGDAGGVIYRTPQTAKITGVAEQPVITVTFPVGLGTGTGVADDAVVDLRGLGEPPAANVSGVVNGVNAVITTVSGGAQGTGSTSSDSLVGARAGLASGSVQAFDVLPVEGIRAGVATGLGTTSDLVIVTNYVATPTATATGAALDATIALSLSTGVATTGTADDVTIALTAHAAPIAVTGQVTGSRSVISTDAASAHATVSIDDVVVGLPVYAGNAAASGAAGDATAKITVRADSVAISGSAPGARGVTTFVTSGAPGIGTAPDPTDAITVNPLSIVDNIVAGNSVAAPTVVAGLPAGSGVADSPATPRAAYAGLAAVTGTVDGAQSVAATEATGANGTASTDDVIVSLAAQAILPEGTVVAGDATDKITDNAEDVTATGSALDARGVTAFTTTGAYGSGATFDVTDEITANPLSIVDNVAAGDATTEITVSAESSVGTGVVGATSTTNEVQADAATATGTGTAPGAVALNTITVYADNIVAAVVVRDATGSLGVSGIAVAAGAGLDVALTGTTTADSAAVAGAANDAATFQTRSPDAGLADATGIAFDIRGDISHRAPAGAAAGTGAANDAETGIRPTAETAAATGSVDTPAIALSLESVTAEGIGVALAPVAGDTVAAEVANSSVLATDITYTTSNSVPAEVAPGTGVAADITVQGYAFGRPSSASATGNALDAIAATGVSGGNAGITGGIVLLVIAQGASAGTSPVTVGVVDDQSAIASDRSGREVENAVSAGWTIQDHWG